MGKYSNYTKFLPKGTYDYTDMAIAIVKARNEAVANKIDVMANNYKEGMVELRKTTPALMATRLANWLNKFFTEDVPGLYIKDMAKVRAEYRKARPKVPSEEIARELGVGVL